MIHARFLLWLLAACAAAVGQIPVRASGLEIDQVQLRASVSSEALIVDLDIAEGWHAYVRDVGGGMPLAIELADDCDFVAAGALQVPPDRDGEVSGKVRWQLPVTARGKGRDLRAVVTFQVCDALECLAPAEVELRNAPPPNVLLVVDQEDERSARVVKLLKAHRLTVDVVTYDAVTAAQCDGHDVVLADSKRFREGKRIRKQVLGFPRTQSPIVAVGFWGTELVEAHKVAMTSGYI